MKTVGKYAICFFTAILLMMLALTLVFLIPDSALEPWYSKSMAQIADESSLPRFFFNSDAAIMDNYTDRLMMENCRRGTDEDPLHAAMSVRGYPRYWHGYLVTLRPLMTRMTFQHIRFVNMFAFLLLFCMVFAEIRHRLGMSQAVAFGLPIIGCVAVIIPASLQFVSVFLITFITMLGVMHLPGISSVKKAGLLFMLTGMATNFFDFLTAPLLTLGMPLVLRILLLSKDEQRTWKEDLRDIILLSALWLLGYAGCWLMKWILGSAVLQYSVFDEAAQAVDFRIAGSEQFPTDRWGTILLNITTYLFAKGKRPFTIVAVGVAIWFAVTMIKNRPSGDMKRKALILLPALYPYVWFLILSNHSEIHYWFTYRIQAITAFALLAFPILVFEKRRRD